ncbi:MAG TPA: ATP-binding cassette domain-containing protein [Candidatus Hungatella pullicola]|nr:ATP-binding cassette domain-containing protein [Candidatus Hungatella pullicola]
MLYQIKDGTVSVGGELILSHIDFEIRGKEKIALVGRNGAGKTTLLKLIAGKLFLDRDDKRQGPGIFTSRSLTVGMLSQETFGDSGQTVEEELMKGFPSQDRFDRERFAYEQEYDRIFTGFGFHKSDKKKRLNQFSGGERTKIALIRLLLEKPDILLLDEPTNHLDFHSLQWLEDYMRQYEKAVVMVSHDRFFLDRTAEVVYELADKQLARYVGNYTDYRKEKAKKLQLQKKAYAKQQEELKRLDDMVSRFRHKPSKASFVRAKKHAAQRLERLPKPQEDETSIFTGEIVPEILGSKWVFQSEHLKIGYDKVLAEITIRIRRGQKIAVLGDNGAGKTTFLKTAAGFIPPVSGEYCLGNHVTIGYFDQRTGEISSEKSVVEHFSDLFPQLTDKEVRSVLGAYLFPGQEAWKKVKVLSGGEKSRLVLAELLQSRPNFLILDEPTNHMDIPARETLESAFQAYKGTMLFVSHDRYFINQVADALLIFDGPSVWYYPFGYDHYLERLKKLKQSDGIAGAVRAEEQALIAGLRAVPKEEKHRLKEPSAEAAYTDWKLRLMGEKLMPYRDQVEKLWEERESLRLVWQASEGFWNGRECREEKELEKISRHLEEAWSLWHEMCMEWYEEAEELFGWNSEEGVM